MEPRWPKDRCKMHHFFWCLLESIFGLIFVDFRYQYRAQMGPMGAKMDPKWRQDGVRTVKKSKKNINATKKRVDPHRPPPQSRKSRQHGPNLGPKMEPRWQTNLCRNASFFWCLLEFIFGPILVDFGSQNRAKLTPKWDQKSMLTPTGVFSNNIFFLRKS